ncbi:MAG: alpha/beta hydrolase [Pseudomonadales bacterium]
MSTEIPLVMLPGSLCDERLFAPQLAFFQGRRKTQVGSFTGCDSIAAMAENILATAPPSFALLGLSMGGIVALEIMRQAPHRVDRLALLNTNPYAQQVDAIGARRQQMQEISTGGLPALQSLVGSEFFPRYVTHKNLVNDSLKDTVLAMSESAGLTVFQDQWRALISRPDSAGTLADIECPTLILCGTEDQMCSPQLHREMAALIKNCQLEIIADCGHLSTLEAPATVNKLLQAWLNT